MEITLEFNLGPQHLLENLVDEVYLRRTKEYVLRQDSLGRFVHRQKHDGKYGSSIKTFRKIQEDKSKFSKELWE